MNASRSSKRSAVNGRRSVDDRSSDFEELLACLNARNVRAVIIGGHALAFHGHPRYTKDLDVFVDPTLENAVALLEALTDFGFGSVPVFYLGREAFLKNKQAAGRPQDLADIDTLN